MAIAERTAVGHQSSDSAPAGRGGRPGGPPSIFVSYSHKDEALVERMLAHLLVLQTYGIARIFYDQEIQRGEKWRDRILEEIDGATVIICLLSADYLSSEFVNSDEIPRIRERQAAGVPVIPVLLRSCPWQVCDWLEERQLFTLNGKALDLGKPKEVEQRFADLTLEVFHLLAEHPDFDPPGVSQADAAEETATEPDVRGAEDPKILKAKDRFRRKALLEVQVRSALERLVAERMLGVAREAAVHLYLILTGVSGLADRKARAKMAELVTGLRSSLSDRDAIVFSSTLYQRLAAGDGLAAALQAAKSGFDCYGYVVHVYNRPKLDTGWDDECFRLPDLRAGFAGGIYTPGARVGRGNDDGTRRWGPPPNVGVYTQTPIQMIYTSGKGWAKAADDGGWYVNTAGAADNSGEVIKIVLPDVSLWNVDEGAVLRFERDGDWWSSAPASSFQARSPYRWGPFVFQDDWLCSPGINYDLIDGTLDGISLPNDVPDFSRDERRGPYPVAAWGDIGSLSAGNGEAQYVC